MKILVYKYLEDLNPTGGSDGYCFNILQELKKRDEKSVCFLEGKVESKYEANSLKKYFQTFHSLNGNNKTNVNFNEYDAVHFHSAKELYQERKNLKGYKGKIIFTMHSPIPYHIEMVENIKKHHKFLGLFLRKHAFSKIDVYAFNRADVIILPCEEAEEAYYSHWKKYRKLHENNKDKYRYIPTGIVGAKAKIDAKEYRKSIGYSDDDFIISYVGRHNEVKGYDRIIKVCELLNNENIKFLVAGKEEPIKGPNYNNWKEIGWTNDPYSLINASNVFILPNRETYFDIVLLEVLSLGKECLISRTGGNKVILSNNCNGIYGFDNEKECAETIGKLFNKKHSFECNNAIVELFEKNYSIEFFVDKYLELLKEIAED